MENKRLILGSVLIFLLVTITKATNPSSADPAAPTAVAAAENQPKNLTSAEEMEKEKTATLKPYIIGVPMTCEISSNNNQFSVDEETAFKKSKELCDALNLEDSDPKECVSDIIMFLRKNEISAEIIQKHAKFCNENELPHEVCTGFLMTHGEGCWSPEDSVNILEGHYGEDEQFYSSGLYQINHRIEHRHYKKFQDLDILESLVDFRLNYHSSEVNRQMTHLKVVSLYEYVIVREFVMEYYPVLKTNCNSGDVLGLESLWRTRYFEGNETAGEKMEAIRLYLLAESCIRNHDHHWSRLQFGNIMSSNYPNDGKEIKELEFKVESDKVLIVKKALNIIPRDNLPKDNSNNPVDGTETAKPPKMKPTLIMKAKTPIPDDDDEEEEPKTPTEVEVTAGIAQEEEMNEEDSDNEPPKSPTFPKPPPQLIIEDDENIKFRRIIQNPDDIIKNNLENDVITYAMILSQGFHMCSSKWLNHVLGSQQRESTPIKSWDFLSSFNLILNERIPALKSKAISTLGLAISNGYTQSEFSLLADNLTEDDKKDVEIQNFVLEVSYRELTPQTNQGYWNSDNVNQFIAAVKLLKWISLYKPETDNQGKIWYDREFRDNFREIMDTFYNSEMHVETLSHLLQMAYVHSRSLEYTQIGINYYAHVEGGIKRVIQEYGGREPLVRELDANSNRMVEFRKNIFRTAEGLGGYKYKRIHDQSYDIVNSCVKPELLYGLI